MLPVIYNFIGNTPGSTAFMYFLAFALVVYATHNGWSGATGGVDKKGEPLPPTRDDRIRRAGIFAAIGIALAGVGLYYALPSIPFYGKAKGEGIPIHTYGVLVGGGFIAAATVAGWLLVREWPGKEGLEKRNQLFDMAFYLFIGAMIGSRVLFIIVNWKDYAADPSKIFSLGGGLVFYGGLIGASITAWFYARKHNIDFVRLADVCLPTVSLGQAFGRLGCFSAGCCWGDIAPNAKTAVQFPGTNATTLFGGAGGTPSLAFQSQAADQRFVTEATGLITHQAVPGAVKIADWAHAHGHSLPVHPTQLYESFGQMVVFASLLYLRRFRRFHGQIAGMWLMTYAVLRSSVELFRGDVERGTLHGLLGYLGANSLAEKVPLEAWYNVSTSQFISICMFALGSSLLVRGYKGLKAYQPVDLGAAAPA